MGEPITIHTAHYTFNLDIRNNFSRGVWFSQHLVVGDPIKPCLSLNISTVESLSVIPNNKIDTAKLCNIEALYNCVLEDDAEDLFSKYSFGKELLEWVIEYIKTEFKHVKFLELDDQSYIPCNRETNETLDLLTYSIAVNKKTWYELHFNAFINDKQLYEKYNKQIQVYSLESTKSDNWDTFFLKNFTSMYARDTILQNEGLYKNMYEESKTFPEFFRKLANAVGKEEKCKFFKWWLQEFISSNINISRRWTIKLKVDGGKSQRKSRRLRK